MGLFFSNRFVGELYEAVDVMIFVYAKPYGSMFIWFNVKCNVYFSDHYTLFMWSNNISDVQV